MRSLLRSLSMIAALALLIWVTFGVLSQWTDTPAAPQATPEDEPPELEDALHLDLHADADGWVVRSGEEEFRDAETLAAWLSERHPGRPRLVVAHPGVESTHAGEVMQAALREPYVDVRLQRVSER